MVTNTVVAYAVNGNKISLLGEVLNIRKPGPIDTWAGNFPFILDIKDEDNDRAKSMLWRGLNDPYMVLVELVSKSLDC